MKAYERLLKYVQYPTASDGQSQTCPSTPAQREFGEALVEELKDIGLSDAMIDENGYVYATLPANTQGQPVIGLIAHMDVVSEVPCQPMKAHIVENYAGGDIVLDEEGKNILSPAVFPSLNSHIGKSLIVTDGNTILGADDKAGIAEIMTLCEYLIAHPEIPHGAIRVGFTPDEEIGRGADRFDVKGFGADFAYTMDGGELPAIEYENFNAASARITVNGRSTHPGDAKDKMKNAARIAAELVSMLPEAETPEHTEGHEGFIHVGHISGGVEKCEVFAIIRDHDGAKFEAKKAYIQAVCALLNQKYGEGTVEVALRDGYRNMLEVIKDHMDIVRRAEDAFTAVGLQAISLPVRGGTDGATLSYMGLPCPNLATGGYNYHGRFEYAVIDDMETMVRVLAALVTA